MMRLAAEPLTQLPPSPSSGMGGKWGGKTPKAPWDEMKTVQGNNTKRLWDSSHPGPTVEEERGMKKKKELPPAVTSSKLPTLSWPALSLHNRHDVITVSNTYWLVQLSVLSVAPPSFS